MRNWLRLPPPLRLAIPALVLIFNLCFVALTALLITKRDRERKIDRIESRGEQRATRLAVAAAKWLTSGKPGAQAPALPEDWPVLDDGSGAERVLLVSTQRLVLFSTGADQRGRRMEHVMSAEAIPVISQSLDTGDPEQIVIGGESAVTVQPLGLVRPPEFAGAVLVLEQDIREEMETLKEYAVSDTVVAILFMLFTSLGLWLALKSYLSYRARALVQRVRSTTGATPVPLAGGDELDDLSRALRESEDRFRQVSTCIRDVFYMVDADWSRVLYVNPAYEEVWGRTIESLMETPGEWMQSVVEADREDVIRHHDPLRHGASSVRLEYRIRRPDGSVRWIENRAFPVLDEQGNLCRIAGLARDVTGRKQLEKDVLNATEQERRRMGRDLHDDLCQRLAAIKIKCEIFTETLKRGEPPDVQKASELCAFIGDASALCRGVARTLVPIDLAGEGLMVALDRLVKTLEALHEVPCFFHCPHSVMVESTSASVHLYRITQEFLNNAIRHGKPSRVDVRLESNADFVRVEVVNDGRPFKEPGSQSGGMGLKILHFRADAISATIRIQPRSDGVTGTIATCLAPHSVCNPDTPSKS